MKKLLIIIGFNLLASGLTQAASFTVSNTNDSFTGSLRHKLSIAGYGDTIRFDPALLANGSDTIILSSQINVNKAIVIKGLYTSNDTLYISGKDVVGIFFFDFLGLTTTNQRVVLDSLVLINGNSIGDGGAINFSYGDSLIINNSIIRNCHSASMGGAIYAYDYQWGQYIVKLYNSLIEQNTSTFDGGGIYCNYGSALIVEKCRLLKNGTPWSGGAISAIGTLALFLNDCVVESNTTGGFGGGMYNVSLDSIIVNNSIFRHNTSVSSGGGLYLSQGRYAHITNTILDSNITSAYGGGVFLFFYNHSPVITDCSITNNTADIGGGVFARSMKMRGTLVSNNTAINNGGGVYTSDILSKIDINNCTIEHNSCRSLGGGIHHRFGSLKLSNTTISHNSGAVYGGGVYSANLDSAEFINTTISHNSSLEGGGVYDYQTSSIQFVNSTITKNVAQAGCDGLYVDNGNTQVILGNCILADNDSLNFFQDKIYMAPNLTPIVSRGYNLIGDSAIPGTVATDQMEVDSISLNLGSLQNNGGFTKTHSPKKYSIAINRGNPLDTTDAQNGSIIGGIRDIGAAESPFTEVVKHFSWTGCDSLSISGKVITQSGLVIDTLVSRYGHDSLLVNAVRLNKSFDSIYNVVSCVPYMWIDGITYTTSIDSVIYSLNTSSGCDSTSYLNLTINSDLVTDTIVSCNPITWIDGKTYQLSNYTAKHTLTNIHGCDSIVKLSLTINRDLVNDVMITCDSVTWIDGKTYTSSNNTATYTLTNIHGCDSIISLHLTVSPDTGISQNITHLSSNVTGAIYQWVDCSNNFAIISGEIGQTFVATKNGSYALIISENGCTDTSKCFSINNVDIEEYQSKAVLTPHPNPTEGTVEIEVPAYEDQLLIEVHNSLGQIISAQSFPAGAKAEIELGESSGIYFVGIKGSNTYAVFKIVKQ